jgi:hypothetical protein
MINHKILKSKEKNITSQYGEDGIIDFLVDYLKADINKVCLEVGAGDGVTNSNVYTLWKEKGWQALLIDASPLRFKKLKKITSEYSNVIAVHDEINFKGEKTIENHCNIRNISLEHGLVVIDVDSIDCHVFEDIDKVNPAICIIEYNNSIPPWIDYQDSKSQIFLRCSIKALKRIGSEKGFQMIGSTITNAIFVREDLAKKYSIESVDPEVAYQYDQQHENHSLWTYCVSSQLVTSYPVFLWKPNLIDYLYFHLRAFFRSLIMRKESYVRPNKETIKSIISSGLWV